MASFEDRENAFENKYAHDAEMQFKAEARRNKLLGLWAAELMGKSGDDAAGDGCLVGQCPERRNFLTPSAHGADHL